MVSEKKNHHFKRLKLDVQSKPTKGCILIYDLGRVILCCFQTLMNAEDINISIVITFVPILMDLIAVPVTLVTSSMMGYTADLEQRMVCFFFIGYQFLETPLIYSHIAEIYEQQQWLFHLHILSEIGKMKISLTFSL